VLALMLLLSPMSSKPHFCTLLVPQLLLARLGWSRRDRLLIALAVVTAVLGLLANKDIVGRMVYDVLLWNGSVFGTALLLFLGCCSARWRYVVVSEPVTVFAARVVAPVEPMPRSATARQPISLRKSSNR
jgi:hypothetical protein